MKPLTTKLILILLITLVCSSFAVSATYLPKMSPDIEVKLVSQDPDPVKAGDIVEVRFKVENNGTETPDDVQLELQAEYPFSLYGSPSIRNLGKLKSSQTGADAVIVDYKLKVDEAAVEGDNELKLVVLFDGQKQFTYEDIFVDIETYDLPTIKVYVKESSIFGAGEKGNLVIEVANTDIGDARFVQMTLLPSADYQILSRSNYAYLGDIDSDDTESEEFEIYIEPGVEEMVVLPVLINYEDTNEINYQDQYNLQLRLFSSKELFQFGLKERSFTLPVLAIIIVGVSIFFIWRRRRNKKQKK